MSAHDEEPTPLGGDARRFVEAARPFEKLPSQRKAAVRGRVLAAVAASAATALASGNAAASASATAVETASAVSQIAGASAGTASAAAGVTAKAAGVSLLVKVGLSVTVVTAALGGWMYQRAQNEGRPTLSAIPSSSAVYTDMDEPTHPVAPEPSIQPSAAPEPSASVNSGFPQVTSSPGAGQAPTVSNSPSSVPVDTLAEETKLISAAHAALSKGDASLALSLLDQHATRFPNGSLAPERRAAKAMALCKLGRAAEGQKEAESMFGADSKSPLAEKIRRGCAK
ncbi:MAG: hypothetical protein IPK82_32625 [Polyangiaceae bacterium]|nr:hypothetical protein [Polyangiaceae bacterium]